MRLAAQKAYEVVRGSTREVATKLRPARQRDFEYEAKCVDASARFEVAVDTTKDDAPAASEPRRRDLTASW